MRSSSNKSSRPSGWYYLTATLSFVVLVSCPTSCACSSLGTPSTDKDAESESKPTSGPSELRHPHPKRFGVDVSFPMQSTVASTECPGIDRRDFHRNYLQGCRDHWGDKGHSCDKVEHDRIKQNIDQPQSMVNFTDVGYKKIKTPEHIFQQILGFFNDNKGDESPEEWFTGNVFVNYWDNPSQMIDVNNSSLKGGGPKLTASIHEETKHTVQEWTNQNLIPSSLYGIRVYKEGAVLAPHVDRNPLINSAIINVAQDVDEPWPLEVIGHNGIATNVTMEPGDMVLYESHSIIHGRPYPLKGRYMANLFIHYEPDISMKHESVSDLPPYLKEDSPYGKNWRREETQRSRMKRHQRVKDKAHDQHIAHIAARDGDLEHLKSIIYDEEESHHDHVDTPNADYSDYYYEEEEDDDDSTFYKNDEKVMYYSDKNGWTPFHEAVRGGHTHVVKYLVEERNIDINHRTHFGDGMSPLKIALNHLLETHPVVEYLSGKKAAILNFHDVGDEL